MHALRSILLLSCALLTGPALAAAPLHILVEDAAGPWSNHDGSGYANDIVRAAFAAVGVDVVLDVVPYARCKTLVMKGAAVGCFSMSAAPELEGVVRFSDQPLFYVYPHFYVNSTRPGAATSEAQLGAGTRLGIVSAYEYPASIALLPKRGVLLEAGRSDVINLRKLDAGGLDAALVMTDDLKSGTLLRNQAGARHVKLAFEGPSQGSYLGFSTIHPDGMRALGQFNRGYQRISNNGAKRKIDAIWRARCAKSCPE